MATEMAATAAGTDDGDVVSMALADLGMSKPEEEVKDEPKSEETISDNSDETKDEEESEDPGDDVADEPEEEDEEPETEDKDPSDEEAPNKDKVQRRIDKLIAKQREAEERATASGAELEQLKAAKADLEAQLNQTSRPILSPTADNPLADVDSEDALDQRIQNAQAVRRWALQNSDGTTIKKPDGSEQFVSGEEVKDYLIKADDILTVHAPARRQWINNRMPAVTSAQNLFPDIFKQGTPMNRAYQATIKNAPELLKIPQHELWVGLALYGEQTLMAQQNAKAAKTAAEKKVSSKKSESKPPTPAKPMSNAKSSSYRGGKSAASLSGANLDDLQSWVADSLLG